MANLQILADEQSELLVGGATGAAVAGRNAANFSTEILSRNTTEILSRNTVVVNTARVNTIQANLGLTVGVGVGLGAVGAASSVQGNSNNVGIAQRGA
ncbi:hypothetical protein [Synechococcus sp. CBW1107]|uniref:hypothetical protein n=1 Tax=Synechococcus sp. CBW1107 TaxID=2789857 RepID=UPI002AD39E96|nr:hypothetical protein [Synechococcus sp. CBW1107]